MTDDHTASTASSQAGEDAAATNGHTPGDGGPGSPGTTGRRPGRGRAFMVIVLSLLMGFVGGVGGYEVAKQADDQGSGSAGPTSPAATASSSSGSSKDGSSAGTASASGTLSAHEIYVKDAPGVVHITSKVSVQSTSIFGFPQTQEGEATGSGFVIDTDGHIVTNAHVVDNASSVTVSFSDQEGIPAKIIGKDDSTDVAVLQVDTKGQKLKDVLHVLAFGDSSKAQVGDPVVAIGNPFELDRTLTSGVVSALQRKLEAPNGFSIDNVIQTDAAINPGNSGGPLLNMRGEVIGINSQIETGGSGRGNVGIGFAVPSNTVKRIVDQLISSGKVEHAWLGVSGLGVDGTVAQYFRLPVDHGVLVDEVTDGSPAAKAGIKGGDREVVIDGQTYRLGGDVIVEIDGKKMDDMRAVADYINSRQPGDSIKVTWYHGSSKQEKTIKLGTRPEQATGSTDTQGGTPSPFDQ